MSSYNWFNGKIIEQGIEGSIIADNIKVDSVDSKILKSNNGTVDILNNIDNNNNNIYNVDTLKVSTILKNFSDDNINIDELNILSGTLEYIDETNIYSLVNKNYVDNHAGGLTMDEDGYLYNGDDYVQYMHISEAFYNDRIYTNLIAGKDEDLTLYGYVKVELLNVVDRLEIGYVNGDDENYGVLMLGHDNYSINLLNINDIYIESLGGDVYISGDNVKIEGILYADRMETSGINKADILNTNSLCIGTLDDQYNQARINIDDDNTLNIYRKEGDINIETEEGLVNIDDLNIDGAIILRDDKSYIYCYRENDELYIEQMEHDININALSGDVNINADNVNIEKLSANIVTIEDLTVLSESCLDLHLIHGQIITPPSNQYDLVNKSYVDSITPANDYLIYNSTTKYITDNHNVPIQNLKVTTLETVGTINSGSQLSVGGRIYAENLLLSSTDTSGSPPVLNCPGYGYINKAVFDYATLSNVDSTDIYSLVNKSYVDSKISTRVKYDINIYSTLGSITSTPQPLIYERETLNNIIKNTIYIPSSYINLITYMPTELRINLPDSITIIPENRGFINTISVDNLSTMSNPDYTDSYYYINNKVLYIKSFNRSGTVNSYKNITVIDNIEISWFTYLS